MATKGFFNIRRVDSKVTLKLKGVFDTDNIHWVTKILINRKFFHSTFLELDLSESKNITMQTMAFLNAALKKLEARGVIVRVTSTCENKLTTKKGVSFP
jgi:hypothetical protein